jgi:hypothetical protein
MTRVMAIRDDDEHEAELNQLRHYMWSHDIGSCQSWVEALWMIDKLHEGDAHLPSFNDMMAEGGYVLSHEFENQRGTCRMFDHGSVKNLELLLIEQEGTFDLNLSRNNGIYNLGTIFNYGMMGAKRGLVVLPPHIEDYRRVGLAWTAEVIKQRRARGGLFRKPTTNEGDPFPVGLVG